MELLELFIDMWIINEIEKVTGKDVMGEARLLVIGFMSIGSMTAFLIGREVFVYEVAMWISIVV